MKFKSIKLYIDEEVTLKDITSKIVDFGYQPVREVGEPGDFARRGAMLDIFPLTFECPVRIELDNNVIVSMYSYDINSGKKIISHESMILLPKWEKNVYRRIEGDKVPFSEEIPIDYFVDLNKNDYVVHLQHGIGIFKGFRKLTTPEGKQKKYLTIEYANKEKLYLPHEDMHLIQKFIGLEGKRPKVHKLGSSRWEKTKQRTKKKIWSLAYELLELQAKRSVLEGHAYSEDTEWQKKLEEDFPYEETLGQLKATLEVKKDMEFPYPMDRLLCGDVGYGKTEVALRAAFKAVMDNKQVAMLVPTTILAEQHYNTFKDRLSRFPVNVKMLSRFISGSQQNEIIENIRKGRVDIVIGTHRLLSDDINFKDLGLVIIDEEQRFGVKHKEKLKHMRLLVDVLTLTATPIPRTLYMSLMGAKDMSVIDTPPKDRLPIDTFVEEFNSGIIKEAITEEVKRDGQVYFVHNRVYDIKNVANKLRQMVPEVKIGIAHGQMSSRKLEKIIIKFLDQEIDVLVTTTIIQLGIDIPNVNTLIVNRADRFGLADLYQLKGRVGRFNRKAYAYFLIPKDAVLTNPAKKRLRAIGKHTELGAGFKIAMKDLMIRGAGNLIGKEQHGYIMSVGFDLYCRLLREAISQLKIEKDKEKENIFSNALKK